MEKLNSLSKQQQYCLLALTAIQLIMGILCNQYFKNHGEVANAFYIFVPSMYFVFLRFFGIRNVKIAYISLKKRLIENFGNAGALKKRLKNTIIGITLSGLLFLSIKSLSWHGLICIPDGNTNTIGLNYLLLSVPGQQLVFFIWPYLILRRSVTQPILLTIAIINILLFGNLHAYYPELVTPIMAGVTLGIPSAYLVYILKDPYAAIFAHMAIGSFAIESGLV